VTDSGVQAGWIVRGGPGSVGGTALRGQHREGREDDPLDVEQEHGRWCVLCVCAWCCACLQVERMFAYMMTNFREERQNKSELDDSTRSLYPNPPRPTLARANEPYDARRALQIRKSHTVMP
jgi:hypothetical protein